MDSRGVRCSGRNRKLIRLKLLTWAHPAESACNVTTWGVRKGPMVWLVDGLKHVRESDLLGFHVKEGIRMPRETEVQSGFPSLTPGAAAWRVKNTDVSHKQLCGPWHPGGALRLLFP